MKFHTLKIWFFESTNSNLWVISWSTKIPFHEFIQSIIQRFKILNSNNQTSKRDDTSNFEKTRIKNVLLSAPKLQEIILWFLIICQSRVNVWDQRIWFVLKAAKSRILCLTSHIENLFFVFFSKVPQNYEDSLKASSVIIPTPVLERDDNKYNNNLSLNSSPSDNVALKIEEVSNETSNLMIEDRQQNITTRWISKFIG